MKTNMKTTKKTTLTLIVAALVLSTSMFLTGCGETPTASPDQSASTSSTINKTDPSSPQNSTTSTDAVSPSESGTKSGASSENATEAKSSNGTSSKSDDDKTSDSDKSSGGSASSKSSGGSDSGSSTSGKTSGGGSGSGSGKSSDSDSSGGSVDPHAGKTYHEAVYENVYVVDQEAYSYEEPVYENRVYTVCHVCGAEFDTSYSSDGFWDHIFAHEFAGEGSGYSNNVRKVQVGTNTVNVPEEGHYEKKLVREAGWY